MSIPRLNILFERFLSKTCSPAEKLELAELLLRKEQEENISRLLEKAWTETTGETDLDMHKADELFYSILPAAPDVAPKIDRPSRLFRMTIKRWRAAAAVFLFLTASIYFLTTTRSPKEGVPVAKTSEDVKAPETNRAMITLSDGRTVYLDSAHNGQLAIQGTVKLVKLANGQIAYLPVTLPEEGEMPYNTLINPRGSKVIDMQLSDGSHVWLNAGSSVTYPVAFTGNERRVKITGEAYFEVAHDAGKPFKVSKDEMEVTVLGTHFNVNAFDDEGEIRVTLLEGSVLVSNGTQKTAKDERNIQRLSPGEQAIVTHTIRTNKHVDMEQVMAWKNDLFVFTGDKIQTVMRQVARWYNVEVRYEGTTTQDDFVGIVSRFENVSQVLKMMETTQKVKFRIDGNKITVTAP